MKLCIDCKHYKRATGSRATYIHECWVDVSPVTGEPERNQAENMRGNDMCGKEAKLFEPKDDN